MVACMHMKTYYQRPHNSGIHAQDLSLKLKRTLCGLKMKNGAAKNMVDYVDCWEPVNAEHVSCPDCLEASK